MESNSLLNEIMTDERGWWDTGTGSPESLWMLHLWRCSRPDDMMPWATWSDGVPANGREVGTWGPFQPRAFCDSIIIWSTLGCLLFSFIFSSEFHDPKYIFDKINLLFALRGCQGLRFDKANCSEHQNEYSRTIFIYNCSSIGKCSGSSFAG